MFKRILIANRGEIACRIINTARRLGIQTVAIYSEADQDALHVEMADEAVAIGPAAASQSYLVIDKIIAACRRTRSEAVHPGYGFLSENATFVEALADAGIVFIGPHPGAIAAMGDKIESKKVAAGAGVATVPGFLGTIADAEQAVRVAEEIGYPVMIKASAGGGGKGMRIARSRAEVATGFDRARSEAKSSFGDDRVFLEKFIVDPRHIEIQVLGDKHGNLIHLGERECSIQRRNQKIVEEAPSTIVDANTRQKMGRQALALAKAVSYDSAGTVEFVAGQDKSFYFLEMNTRLQVEHPVTELVTGIDLVEQMIRMAAGDRLSLKQSDVKLSGWAVETRIYAEDPARNFMPSIGRLVRYRPPPESQTAGVTVRTDAGVREGSEISLFYDPMIAKLITHGPTRNDATAAQTDALDAFTIEGVRHNISFLSTLMQNERWKAGQLSTAFLAEAFPNGFHAPVPQGETEYALAAVAACIDHVAGERKRSISGQRPGQAVTRERRRMVQLGESEVRLDIARSDAGPAARSSKLLEPAVSGLNDSPLEVRFIEPPPRDHVLISRWKPGDPVWSGTLDGRSIFVQVRPVLNGFELSHRGVESRAYVYTEREAAAARFMPAKKVVDSGKAVRSPMPGLVISIAVAEGQEVKAGETLAVVEAMKMENVLRADRDGVVKRIHARKGESLAVDAVILEFA
jgi:propionyl-CoA carboxylase alpha chain